MVGLANRKALLSELGQDDEDDNTVVPQIDIAGPPIENTGIFGEKTPVLDQPIAGGPLVDTTPTATPNTPAYDFGRVIGASAEKFNDPNKKDYKYDVLRTLSKYDPRQGFTQDVLNDLNTLGYGTFSSSGGDKLSLTGAKNAKDAKDFTDLDYIFASKDNSPATKWMMGSDDSGGGATPAMHSGGGIGLDPALAGGDPLAAIQAALAKYSNSPNLQALLAQLGAV